MSADLEHAKLLLDILDATDPTERPTLKGLHDRALLELQDLSVEAAAEVVEVRKAKAAKAAEEAAKKQAEIEAKKAAEAEDAKPAKGAIPEVRRNAQLEFEGVNRRV